MKQTISVLVENQAGALNRITGLFARRAFNIESLAVGVTDDPTISRITIIVDSGNSVVEQVKSSSTNSSRSSRSALWRRPLDWPELMTLKGKRHNKTRQVLVHLFHLRG